MAVGIVDRQKLVNIADAVRAKKGITGNMTLDAIASNITSMPTADNNAKFDFSGSGSKSSGKLTDYLTTIDLTGLDTSNYTDMSNMFYNYTSLTSLDLSSFDTSKVTNMSSIFLFCSSLTRLDLSSFDTSKVTDMSSMFNSCSSLTSIDLSSFDTSKVTNMESMFNNCSSLTSIDVSNWNTSSVGTSGYGTSFKGMFQSCSSLESLDISSFDLSNTYSGQYYSLTSMFNICSSLKTLKLPNSVSFNKTDIYLNDMFSNCSSLESLDFTGWDTTNVAGMRDMFKGCWKLINLTLGNDWASNSSISSFDSSSCPLTRESALDVINKLATRDNSPVIKFSSRTGLYQSEIDIATNKGWSVSGCTVLVEDPSTATKGQYALIDGEISKCIYVADEPQSWGQRIFVYRDTSTNFYGNSLRWSDHYVYTGVTDTAIGTGLSNTNALIAMNKESSFGSVFGEPTVWDAITEFRSKHSDRWFIPSSDESILLQNSNFWTSTDDKKYSDSGTNAFVSSNSGIVNSVNKMNSNSVSAFTYV